MADYTVFLSYASADLAAAERLEAWLQAPPRAHAVWRDRRGIAPGAPDFYEPIAEGIRSSANFVVQLSPRWLRSRVSAQEIADAHAAGKKLVPVVHPAIPRDPASAEGRAAKLELFEALDKSTARTLLEPINWIWLVEREGAEPDYAPVQEAIATDFAWKRQHAVIAQRLARWQTVGDASALLRGHELVELVAAAFASDAVREPRLTDAQRSFLLASQQHDAAERERTTALYAGAQARSLAFAARERAEAEPDTALLLAAEAAQVAAVPEARAALGLLLDRHAPLLRVNHAHGPAREVSGLAFSADGAWLASVDRPIALNDERPARLLIHEVNGGRLVKTVPGQQPLTALAWGKRWLAVASRGAIGWVRWDDIDRRFRGNSPTAIGDDVAPDFLAFSPPGAAFADGEWLAWGTRWGDIGVVRVGDHARLRGRVSAPPSSRALAGLGWLADGRLLTAEAGQITVRDRATLGAVAVVATLHQVHSLACENDRWVAAGVGPRGAAGLLFGAGAQALEFLRTGPVDIECRAVPAGRQADAGVLLGLRAARSGLPLVTLADPAGGQQVLLHGEDHPVSALAADAGGRFMAAGDTAGRVWLWDRSQRSSLTSTAALPTGTGAGAMHPVAGSDDDDDTSQALRPTYSLAEAPSDPLGRHWQRQPVGDVSAPAEHLYTPRDPLASLIAEAGDEHLVIADGADLVFLPAATPADHVRRAAHDNPVKHLAANDAIVVSVACSFEDPRVDVLKLWTPQGEPLGNVKLAAHAAGLTIAADGSAVAVAGDGGEQWVLPLSMATWAATAQRIAGRALTEEEARRYRVDSWRARRPEGV